MPLTARKAPALLRLAVTLVILALCASSQDCEDSIDSTMSECFAQYHALATDVHYFKGMDAETLRSICTSIKHAMRCTHRKCPDAAKEQLFHAIPSHVLPVMDICVHKDIIEVYARNQFCFLQTSSSSERCFNNYKAATQHLLEMAKYQHKGSIEKLCIEYSRMLECMKTTIESDCTEEALILVELLVKPSAPYSQHCGVEPTTHSPTIQPVRPYNPSSDIDGQQSIGDTATRHSTYGFLLLTTLVTLIHIL